MLLKAFAKINWSLDITGIRPDGYHLMDMVMQPVSLADDITLLPSNGISITTGGTPFSRADESNLAYRAAEALKNISSTDRGVQIHLYKQIPMGAGMGGGSADAAAVLFGLNRLWDLRYSSDRLEEIGLSLGADVPFCLRGKLARVRGIGEEIENHPFRSSFWLLVFQPCRALSTRDVFQAYQEAECIRRPDTVSVLKALAEGDLPLLSVSMSNVLESVSSARCPEISEAISVLLSHGAMAAQMTGSGSAVFGVFRSRLVAEKVKSLLSPRYRNIHLCHTQSDSIRMMEE